MVKDYDKTIFKAVGFITSVAVCLIKI